MNVNAILKYVPVLAAVYAVYEAYGSRGLSGFLADLKALPNVLKNPDAMKQLGIGVGILLVGTFIVSKFAPRGWVKYVAYGAIYYFAVTQIATAIRSGAGYGYVGTGRMTPQRMVQ